MPPPPFPGSRCLIPPLTCPHPGLELLYQSPLPCDLSPGSSPGTQVPASQWCPRKVRLPLPKAFGLIAIQLPQQVGIGATPLCQAADRVPTLEKLQSHGQGWVVSGTGHLTPAQGSPLLSQHPRDRGSWAGCCDSAGKLPHTNHSAKMSVTP